MLSLDYIAGFMDADGCFLLARTKTSMPQPSITITNCDKATLCAIQNTLAKHNVDSRIYERKAYGVKNPKYKNVYSLWIKSSSNATFCAMMIPRLMLKRRRAKLVLEYINFRHPHKKYTELEMLQMLSVAGELKVLNKRGKI